MRTKEVGGGSVEDAKVFRGREREMPAEGMSRQLRAKRLPLERVFDDGASVCE
jgi:hypothetical protein